MLFELLTLVLSLPASLLGSALLLRAYTQRIKLHPYNPLSQFLFKLTDWLVRPLRRLIPGTAGLDWASLIGAWLIAILLMLILAAARSALAGIGLALLPSPGNLCLLGLIKVAQWAAATALLLVFIGALLSWFQLNSPLGYVVLELLKPILRPLQKRLPSTNGIDFSPMILIFLLLILQHVLTRAELYLTPVGTLLH